jgi:hypothetical protein
VIAERTDLSRFKLSKATAELVEQPVAERRARRLAAMRINAETVECRRWSVRSH